MVIVVVAAGTSSGDQVGSCDARKAASSYQAFLAFHAYQGTSESRIQEWGYKTWAWASCRDRDHGGAVGASLGEVRGRGQEGL